MKEFGEGVDRMYREMEEAGCPAPEYKQVEFMVYATIRQKKGGIVQVSTSNSTSKSTSKSTSSSTSEKMVRLVRAIKNEMSIREMMEVLEMKSRPMFLNNYLTPALKAGYIEMTQPNSPKSPTQRYRLTEAGRRLLESINE